MSIDAERHKGFSAIAEPLVLHCKYKVGICKFRYNYFFGELCTFGGLYCEISVGVTCCYS